MEQILANAAQRNGMTASLLQTLYYDGFSDNKITVESVTTNPHNVDQVLVKFEEGPNDIRFSKSFANKTRIRIGDYVVVIPGGSQLVFSEEELKAVNTIFSKYIED